jgi:hypothetical protein
MEPLADDERHKLNSKDLNEAPGLVNHDSYLYISQRMFFYRQPSGCLEIGQDGDIVHICSGSIEQFIAKLQAFVDRAPV